jgi:hypothetical protein
MELVEKSRSEQKPVFNGSATACPIILITMQNSLYTIYRKGLMMA